MNIQVKYSVKTKVMVYIIKFSISVLHIKIYLPVIPEVL